MINRATIDTNIAVYALTDRAKAAQAWRTLASADFVSVQLLNELVHVSRRKMRFDWDAIALITQKVRQAVGQVIPICDENHVEALRISQRYRLYFYDSLMLAVALSGGARTFYSEDMQHDMVIDGVLRVVDPFRVEAE